MADETQGTLDPFDASTLNVLARVPSEMTKLKRELKSKLRTPTGKAIAKVILSKHPEHVRVSREEKATGLSILAATVGR